VAFGSIELGDLAPGEWKELTREDFEGDRLKNGAQGGDRRLGDRDPT
jgi:16S rRNA U516 pseudouridylate synthase RsuA-like enzyme